MIFNVRSGEIVIGTVVGGIMERSSPPLPRMKEEKKTSFMICDILDSSPRSSRSQCRVTEEREAEQCCSKTITSPENQREWSPGELQEDNVDDDQKDLELQPQSPCGVETDTPSSQDSHGTNCRAVHMHASQCA